MSHKGKHRRNASYRGKHRAAPDYKVSKAVAVAGTAGVMVLGGTGLAGAAPQHNWDEVAMCESSGNWGINTGNGFYGGLQFLHTTWVEFGGQVYAEYANQATVEQQIEIAEKVLAVQGIGAWPVCGAFLKPGSSVPPSVPVPAVDPAPAAPAPAPAPSCQSSYEWPVDGPLTSGYGDRSGGFHDGADFGAPIGTPIHAATSGTILAAGDSGEGGGGYGNWIRQAGDDGNEVQYGHISDWYVSPGQWVSVGDVIGAVGNAGSSTGPHLHLRMSVGDPVAHLKAMGACNTGEHLAPPPAPAPAPAPAPVDVPAPVADAPAPLVDVVVGDPAIASAYVVVEGDNLSYIASLFGTSWQGIYDLNRGIIDNPDLIYPDQVLNLK